MRIGRGSRVARRPQPAGSGTAARPATAAGNRRLSVEQARRLMSLAPVPAGARVLRRAPAALRRPAMGTLRARSGTDISRSWRLTMTIGQALAWLTAHRPHGLRPDGSSTDTEPGPPLYAGYSYSGRLNPAWQSADLEVEVAATAGGTAVLRADAVVVWLDPVPVPDNSLGRRLHLSGTAPCPATDRSIGGVTNTGPGLRRQLLPAVAPTAALECRYYA